MGLEGAGSVARTDSHKGGTLATKFAGSSTCGFTYMILNILGAGCTLIKHCLFDLELVLTENVQ